MTSTSKPGLVYCFVDCVNRRQATFLGLQVDGPPVAMPAAEDPVGGAEEIRKALVRTGLTPHNVPADCSNDRADECSRWTNSSKAAISIAK